MAAAYAIRQHLQSRAPFVLMKEHSPEMTRQTACCEGRAVGATAARDKLSSAIAERLQSAYLGMDCSPITVSVAAWTGEDDIEQDAPGPVLRDSWSEAACGQRHAPTGAFGERQKRK
jgi:hypothetical protein